MNAVCAKMLACACLVAIESGCAAPAATTSQPLCVDERSTTAYIDYWNKTVSRAVATQKITIFKHGEIYDQYFAILKAAQADPANANFEEICAKLDRLLPR